MRFATLLLMGLPCILPHALAEPPKAAKPSALDKATLESYIRRRFFWGSQYTVKVADPKPGPMPGYKEVMVEIFAGQASKAIPFYVSDNGQKVIFGEVYDIAQSPFQADLDKLKTDGSPSFGPADAPVTFIMFSDFQCTFCKEEAQVLREKIRKEYPTQVRVFFKDHPLDAIHPWARAAAIDGRCVYRQNPAAFWDFHDWIYDNQGDITPDNMRAKVLEFAGKHNLEILGFTACIDRRSTESEVNRTVAEGKALGIDSTPTIYINGRKLVGKVEWNVIKQVIDDEISYQKTVKKAEEACCEVKLPAPFKD